MHVSSWANQSICAQAIANLSESLFQRFEFDRSQLPPSAAAAAAAEDEDEEEEDCALSFRLNLRLLLDCLTVFGAGRLASTSLHAAMLSTSTTWSGMSALAKFAKAPTVRSPW